jgi:hypothetical protein
MELRESMEKQIKNLPKLEENLKAIDDKMNRLIINRKYLHKKIKRIVKVREQYDKANQTL